MQDKIFVGVDCHKSTIACYCNGNYKEFPTTKKGFEQALKLAPKDCNWALECAYNLGLTFATFLITKGCKVYDFNALSTAKARKMYSISGEKSDYMDAKIISKIASDPDIPIQEVSIKTIELTRKISKRDLFVKQRTEITNNLKAGFIQEGLKPPYKRFTSKRAIQWLLKQENTEMNYAGEMLNTLNNVIEKIEKEIEELTPSKAKNLTQIKGISTLRASQIYARTKGKIMTKAQFASYCGVAPIKNESGSQNRHRNNKRGDRKLNSILYSISVCQSKYDPIGSDYYLKKIGEGKTKHHARKCLSRQISNQIYKILFKN